MNRQLVRLCSLFRLSLPSNLTFLPRQSLSTIAHQRFRNYGYYRQFRVKCSPRNMVGFSSNIKVYCTQKVPEKKTKEYTENIVTIPNILTVGRMAMCPVLGNLEIYSNKLVKI